MKYLFQAFLLLILTACADSNKSAVNLDDINSIVEFEYSINSLAPCGTHLLEGKISNISKDTIIILTSKCISETTLLVLEGNDCEIEPCPLCGIITCGFRELNPNEVYDFQISLNCENDNLQLKPGFKIFEAKNRSDIKNQLKWNEIENNPEEYYSKIIWGKEVSL